MKKLSQLISLLILCNNHLFAQQSQLGQVPKILIDTSVNQNSYYTTVKNIIPTTDNGFYNINSFSGVRTTSGFFIVNKFGTQKYQWKKSLNPSNPSFDYEPITTDFGIDKMENLYYNGSTIGKIDITGKTIFEAKSRSNYIFKARNKDIIAVDNLTFDRIDSLGKFLIKKDYKNPMFMVKVLAELSDGSFLTQYASSDRTENKLLLISAVGDSLWINSNVWSKTDISEAIRVIGEGSNGTILTSNRYINKLVSIDKKTGVIVNNVSFVTSDFNPYAEFSAIKSTTDGGWLATLNQYEGTFDGSKTKGRLIRFNTKGEQVWQKDFSRILDLQPTADGGFVFVQNKKIIKINTQGNSVWEYAIPEQGFNGFFNSDVGYDTRLTTLPDGSFWIVNTPFAAKVQTYASRFTRIDKDGKEIWALKWNNMSVIDLNTAWAGFPDPEKFWLVKGDKMTKINQQTGVVLWQIDVPVRERNTEEVKTTFYKHYLAYSKNKIYEINNEDGAIEWSLSGIDTLTDFRKTEVLSTNVNSWLVLFPNGKTTLLDKKGTVLAQFIDILKTYQTKDGGYMLFSKTKVIKISADGKQIWENTDKSLTQIPAYITDTNENGFALKYTTTNTTIDPIYKTTIFNILSDTLVRLNENGKIVWKKAIPIVNNLGSLNYFFLTTGIKQANDGGLIVYDLARIMRFCRETLPQTLNSTGKTTFCKGAEVSLSAIANTDFSYQWKKDGIVITGANQVNFTAKESGIYSVDIKDNICGISGATKTIEVKVNEAIAQITAEGSLTFYQTESVKLKANTGDVLIYQWKKDGKDITGATNPTYEVKETGKFTVQIGTKDGCSALSNELQSIVLAALAIEPSLDGIEVKISPNPVLTTIQVEVLLEKPAESNLQLFDLQGKKYGNWVTDKTKNHQISIDFNNVPQGIYLLQILVDDKKVVRKILKE